MKFLVYIVIGFLLGFFILNYSKNTQQEVVNNTQTMVYTFLDREYAEQICTDKGGIEGFEYRHYYIENQPEICYALVICKNKHQHRFIDWCNQQ